MRTVLNKKHSIFTALFTISSIRRGLIRSSGAACFIAICSTVNATSPVSDTPIILAESPVSSAPKVDSQIALEGDTEQWSIHGQVTYVNQFKNNFNSPYYGAKSLLNKTDGDISKSYTFSATAFLGTRLWEGAEVYMNPEMFEGIPPRERVHYPF